MRPLSVIPLNDERLPLWMRRARRGFDVGVLVSLLIGLSAAAAFLGSSSLPRTNNAEHYVFQTADYADVLREGRIWSRWSPHAFGGYGTPVPHFSPPAPVYTAALISAFVTQYEVTAVRIVFAGSLCLAACAVYALVLRRSSAEHGVLASALYVLSPSISLALAQVDGELPLVMAAMLLPALLWSLDRLMSADRTSDLLLVSGITAALWLTHMPLAGIGAAAGFAYVIWRVTVAQAGRRWQHALLSLMLGILLAAPFWLPAATETELVRWIPPELPPAAFTLSELFQLPEGPDPAALLHVPVYTVGLVMPAMVVAAAAFHFRRRDFRSLGMIALIAFLLLILAVVVLTEAPAWLLIPLTLTGSIAATSVLEWRLYLPANLRQVLLPACIVVITLAGLPIIQLDVQGDQIWDTSPAAQVQYEVNGYGVAVAPPDQPIPTALTENATLSASLVTAYPRNQVIRLNADPAEITVQISSLAERTHSQSYQIRTLTGGNLRVLTAAFPGWVAMLNSSPIDLQVEAQTGLMRLQLPASASGELTLSLETTPIRFASWFVAIGAALCLAYLWSRRHARNPSDAYEDLHLLTPAASRLLLLTLAGLAMVISLLWLTNRSLSVPGSRLEDAFSYASRTNSGLELLAFDLERADFRPGDQFEVQLYLRALRFLDQNYRIRAALIDLSTGDRIAPISAHHPGGYPTRRWIPGRYVMDTLRFEIPERTEPTSLAISIEAASCLPNCDAAPRLTFFSSDGETLGDRLVLPVRITVSP